RYDRADRLSKFGIVILMDDLRFVDGIKVRIDDDDPENWILVIRAVQFERRPGKVLPVRFNLLRTLGVFAGGVPPVKTLRSGREQLQGREVSIVDGKVFHGS